MTKYYNSPLHTHRIISVSKKLFKKIHLILLAMIVVIVGSCEKQVLKIGADILPTSDFVKIKSIDTLSVFSYTMENDSTRTDNPSICYLGQLYDPYFGTTSAGFVSQIRLISAWGGENITVDSTILYLHLLSTIGKATGTVHTLSLYEISDQIYNDSAYYSNTPLNLTDFSMTNIKLPTLRTDTINTISLTLPGNGVEFGNYLLRDTSKLFYSNSVPDFRSFFKGLYFKMDPSTDPLFCSLTPVSDLTRYYNYFTIYGHLADSTQVTYSFSLDAKNANASYNRYSHDFSTATLGNKMVYVNTTHKDTISYAQALNGVFTKISLPGLEDLKKDPAYSKIAVNKAKLVVPIEFNKSGGSYYLKSVPSKLLMRYSLKSGVRYNVPDYTSGGLTNDPNHQFFDGNLDTIAGVYNFNIPGFVQSYLKDAADQVKPEVEIYQPSGLRNVVLKANHNKVPVKFEFTYTEF